MTSFSERMGFVKPPEFMQLDGMIEELSNLLVNYCGRILRGNGYARLSEIEDRNDLLKLKRRSFRLWTAGLGLSPSYDEKSFSGSFDHLECHWKYTVLEAVVFDCGVTEDYNELNQILERENSGYRLNADCQLVPIANQQELDEVSEAQHSKVDMVALHINRAVACFAIHRKAGRRPHHRPPQPICRRALR